MVCLVRSLFLFVEMTLILVPAVAVLARDLQRALLVTKQLWREHTVQFQAALCAIAWPNEYTAMSISRTTLSALCLFLCVTGCKREPGVAAATALDACALLTNDEVATIQGSPVTESKSSANANNGLRAVQCYYATSDSNKSVSVAVTQGDTQHPGKQTAWDVWKGMFNEDTREAKEREGEEGEKMAAPIKIDGVGDEAYWTGAKFGGALYVLRREKDTFMRISVGGGDTAESKIEKCKALARKALDRL